ncbi:glycosyltransferase [Cereibacter sp. SYSU M97828]|nr:glycosyltransferase [Cereibacter flavus]
MRVGQRGIITEVETPRDVSAAVLPRIRGTRRIDALLNPPDPRLIDLVGPALCLREGVLPWRNAGGTSIVAVARPETLDRLRPLLESRLGPVACALCPESQIAAALIATRGAELVRGAETTVPDRLSCRSWNISSAAYWVQLALVALAGCLLLWPIATLGIVAGWAVLALICGMGLKLAAAIAAHRAAPVPPPPPIIARLPTVSVIVALYREADIAPRLVRRLAALDYPRDLLDIVLAVEERDSLTRDALARTTLPDWMRIVVVPRGHLKTKPRALNFALTQCRGSIIGVYDAEDAPAPDQIRRVATEFHRHGPDVGCLQGILDFYNPRTNWIARCFTVEYATLFRVLLPGFRRLGLAIPLGGTTLFIRRSVLEQLGAWDAHNVTEDADLGIRLARAGYRTEMIDTVTHEEANCRPLAWIRQRSRWQKGYMMTWCIHMREPLRLWRDLGTRAFFGFQTMFLLALSQVLLAPVLWSFWALSLGLWHPLADTLPPQTKFVLIGLFLLTEAVNITLGILALRRTRHRLSPLWVPTLILYFPLATLSAYKALREMITAPFFWDKTQHGKFDT